MYNRPTGVTILAAITFIGGVWAICAASAAFAWSPIAVLFGDGSSVVGAAIYNMLRGFVYIGLGIGLWNLKPWARTATIIVSGIHLFYNALAIFTPWGIDWIGAIIAIVIIWYLLKQDIKYTFKG